MKKAALTSAPIETAFEFAAYKTTALTLAAPVNENNDDLYRELEHRYGGGYAQAIVEGLKRSQKN